MIESGIIYLLPGLLLVPAASYLTYFYTKKHVSRSVESITASVKEIGSGNLTVHIRQGDDDDEIFNELALAINEMTGRLINTISKLTYSAGNIDKMAGDIYKETAEVKDIARDQKEVSHDMASSVNDVKNSIQEIYESIESLKMASSESIGEIALLNEDARMMVRNISELKPIVEKSSLRVGNMTGYVINEAKTIKGLKDHCENVLKSVEGVATAINEMNINNEGAGLLAQKVLAHAEVSAKKVEETVKGIAQSREIVESSSRIMEEVDERSDEISEVVEIINGITDRTKLLALNASIIAAEAGEYGKSFAVVADEVEKLSNMITSSTEDIKELVGGLQSWAGKGISSMKEGLHSIDESVALAESAGKTFEKIFESSHKAADASAGLLGSGKEQSTGILNAFESAKTIQSMIGKISVQSQEEASRSNEINSLMHDMRGLMERVNSAVEKRSSSTEMISESYEVINEMLHHIQEASQRQYEKGEEIVAGTERITKSSGVNVDSSEKLNSLVKPLKELSAILKEEVESFKM
ncbi:MAG: methyl-accepting chemotaxis protein [Deltaproteobacteria bacterium]|nr:methyl-accepting chemotaxis protein [Deltaproteobacteria bacterium]